MGTLGSSGKQVGGVAIVPGWKKNKQNENEKKQNKLR
jgi:hypothetical protein